MTLARIFQSGNSQAVRLPKEFRFDASEVEIFRRGDEVVLRLPSATAGAIFDALSALPADLLAADGPGGVPQGVAAGAQAGAEALALAFSTGRDDTPPQEREAL